MRQLTPATGTVNFRESTRQSGRNIRRKASCCWFTRRAVPSCQKIGSPWTKTAGIGISPSVFERKSLLPEKRLQETAGRGVTGYRSHARTSRRCTQKHRFPQFLSTAKRKSGDRWPRLRLRPRKWWARPDSNRQPSDYESPAPPLSYRPTGTLLERARPILYHFRRAEWTIIQAANET